MPLSVAIFPGTRAGKLNETGIPVQKKRMGYFLFTARVASCLCNEHKSIANMVSPSRRPRVEKPALKDTKRENAGRDKSNQYKDSGCITF